MKTIATLVRQELGRAKQQLRGMLRRGKLTLLSADALAQVSTDVGDERFDDAEYWQHFGLTSRPPAGGDVLLVEPDGRGEGAIAVATTDWRHRPADLAEGDTVLYAQKAGASQARIYLKADGSIAISPAPGKVVAVGGNSDALLKGNSFKSALDVLLSAWQTAAASLASGAVDPAAKAYGSAMNQALTAFRQTSSSWLATRAKVS